LLAGAQGFQGGVERRGALADALAQLPVPEKEEQAEAEQRQQNQAAVAQVNRRVEALDLAACPFFQQGLAFGRADFGQSVAQGFINRRIALGHRPMPAQGGNRRRGAEIVGNAQFVEKVASLLLVGAENLDLAVGDAGEQGFIAWVILQVGGTAFDQALGIGMPGDGTDQETAGTGNVDNAADRLMVINRDIELQVGLREVVQLAALFGNGDQVDRIDIAIEDGLLADGEGLHHQLDGNAGFLFPQGPHIATETLQLAVLVAKDQGRELVIDADRDWPRLLRVCRQRQAAGAAKRDEHGQHVVSVSAPALQKCKHLLKVLGQYFWAACHRKTRGKARVNRMYLRTKWSAVILPEGSRCLFINKQTFHLS